LDLLHGCLGDEVEVMLSDVPNGLPLADPKAAQHIAPGSAADQVWDLLVAQDGVGWVTAGKILARKRPHLLPVYDHVVACAVGQPEGFWSALHQALIENNAALQARLARLRDSTGISGVSTLRVLDVALWMQHRGAHSATDCPGLAGPHVS
jgi:hypothetical protein